MKLTLLFVIGATFCVLALAQGETSESSSIRDVPSQAVKSGIDETLDNSDATEDESQIVEESRYYGRGWRGGRRGGGRRWG